MSELSEKVRQERREKAKSYVRTDPRGMKIDASDYSPPDALDADVKTGMRPISRRQFAKGGTVDCVGEGVSARADRKPRKSGGSANEYMNRNQKSANEERDGIKHVGGMKKGGRAKRDAGGMNQMPMNGPMGASAVNPVQNALQQIKNAGQGGVPASMLNVSPGGSSALRRESGIGFNKGGKADGKWIAGAIKHPGALHKELHVKQGEKIPEKKLQKAEHSDNPKLRKRAQLADTLKKINKKDGGCISNAEMTGTRPTGGRIARKSGGKAKGSVNIIISTGAHPQMADPAMPPNAAPVRPPMIPPAASMPQPMPMGAGAPPPAAMPMPGAPMMRRAGGRTYQTPADMDAGSGSGLGRLEKTEMQKKKA